MKFFAIILSIVVLWLTLMPCIDTPEQNCSPNTEMAQQHSHSEDIDLCSPFCTCHCCQSCVHLPMMVFTLACITQPERLYPITFQDVPNDFNFDLYKPPRA